MWVRIQEFSFVPEQAEQVIQQVRDHAAVQHEGEGYRGFRLLVDRPSGRALDVSYWDTERALCARDATEASILTELPAATTIRVTRYELAIDAA
jgi:heme-degrading monooxygenase HmoA